MEEPRKCFFCDKLLLYAHNPIYYGLVRMCDGYHPECFSKSIENIILKQKGNNKGNKTWNESFIN